jgi:diacylglycerol kinase family enzyme
VSARVDLVLNSRARRLGPGSAERRRLVAEADRGGAHVHDPADHEALSKLALTIAERGTDGVVFAGGDGSFMRGLSALTRAFGDVPLPPVGLAFAGTVGTVARNLGLRRRGTGVRVLRAACRGATVQTPCPTLRIRDDRGSDAVGFIFGTGLVARFFDVYHAARRPGLATAAGIASRVFVGSFFASRLSQKILTPTECTVTVDGAPRPGSAWSVVVASVLRDVGLHFRVTYRAGDDSERFHVVGSGLPPRRLGPQVTRVLVGRPLVGEPRIDDLARSMRLEFTDASGAYVVDGDVMTARAVVVEPGPVLRLITPE